MKIIIQPQVLGTPSDKDEAADNTDRSPSIQVDNDWRYAVYLWTAAAIAGEVTVTDLDMFEDAGEKRFFEALQDNGVRMSIRAEFVSVRQGASQAFQFDLAAYPQLYLPAIVLAAHTGGTSVLSSAQSAIDLDPVLWQHRIEVLQTVGIGVTIQDGLVIIKGGAGMTATSISETEDPELLAALSILALKAPAAVNINNAHLITSIFPKFFEDLNTLLKTKIQEVK